MVVAKSLTSSELSKIEEEWEDSKVVCQLLAHIAYLNDAIIDLVGSRENDDDGKENTRRS